MAGEVINRSIIVSIVSDDVQKAQESLLKKQEALNAEIKKTNDPKALDSYNKQLKVVEAQISRNEKVMKGELLPTIRQTEAAVRKLNAEYKKTGDPEIGKRLAAATDLLQKQRREMNNLGDASEGLTKRGIFNASFWANLAAGAITGFFQSFKGFLSASIEEALDADLATRKLESTLNNLGRSDAFDRLTRKAEAMAEKFRYLDNDDIVGVFNKLIDYGKLTEKQMNDLLPVIIDFAAKSQISLAESTSVIVKALEGSGKALKEYGINIKDAGSETERMNIVMTTLKGKVDGAGEAFQNSAKGGIVTARQELKNLSEEIGTELIPILNNLLGFLTKALRGIKNFFKEIKDGFRDAFTFKGIRSTVNDYVEKDIPQQLSDQLVDIATNLQDALAPIINGDQILGLGGSGGGKNTSLTKKKKEIEEIINSIKDLGDVLLKFTKDFSTGEAGKGIDFEKAIDDSLASIGKNTNRNNLAFYDLKVLTTTGKQQLAARKQLLDEQMRQELENTNLTENEKLLIQQIYLLLRKQAEDDFITSTLDNFRKYSEIALQVYDIFSQAATSREEAELARDTRLNDRKLRNLDARLKKGIITQKQYDREAEAIRQKQEKKEHEIAVKQFQRNKRAAIAQAVIDGFLTISQIFRTVPKVIPGTIIPNPQFFEALITAAAAKTATIVGIAAQKPPQFAKGSGPLGGELHSSGGNAIVNRQGQKIAEIERGEAIINRHSMADRNTYSFTGTPSQIASQINSMHGRGVSWASSPKYMNYGAINRRYYADGGVFGEGGTSSFDLSSLNRLADVLEKGIVALVPMGHIETQQDRLNRIKADATIVQ